MELKFKISKGTESVECYADFDPENEGLYFYQNNQVIHNIEDLNISKEFMEDLKTWDVHQWLFDAIPWGISTRTGVSFQFDYKHFMETLVNENLFKKWRTLENVHGGDIPVLEKGIVTSKDIVDEFNRILKEAD